jgi:hypothetical protein
LHYVTHIEAFRSVQGLKSLARHRDSAGDTSR